MLRQEILSSVRTAGTNIELPETSSFTGRVNAKRFQMNELYDGTDYQDFYDTTKQEQSFISVPGEDLSPDMIVVLMDCSGSMHHLAKELGAFGTALRLLAQEKDTRILMVVGSDKEHAWVDSSTADGSMGEIGVIDSYEEAFHYSDGGNSPTWNSEDLQKVATLLAKYDPQRVRVIAGTDLAILGSEIDYLRTLQSKYPTLIVNDVPETIISNLGEFIKTRPRETSILHNREDEELVDINL